MTMSTEVAVAEILTLVQAVQPAEQRSTRRTWAPVNLSDVLDGRYEPPRPTVGARADGAGLFYPGRMHTVASESEGGKTWLALAAAQHELHAGRAVLYLDFEDDEGGVVGRLLALGTDKAAIRERFAYLRPEDPVEALGNRDDLGQVLGDLCPTLAVLDGVTEAMSLHGLELKDNTDVAKFGQMLPRWLAERGPATVALDHVTKDRENRGRYAIGAVHKLNGLNGAAYTLDNRQPFGIGVTGRSTLRIAKDRPGQLRRHALPSNGGHWYGDLVLTSHSDTVAEVALLPPADRVDDFRPTVLMERIAKALDDHGPLAARKLEQVVTGKAAGIRQALTFLQLDGYVSEETPHRLLKPYRRTATRSDRVPVSPPCPCVSPTRPECPCPRVPLYRTRDAGHALRAGFGGRARVPP